MMMLEADNEPSLWEMFKRKVRAWWQRLRRK
jgi:hypothetical protein